MHSHWLPCERQVRERWATASTAEGVEIFPPLPVLSFLIKSSSSHTSTFSHFLSYSFLFLLHRYLLVSGCLACAKIMSSLTPPPPFSLIFTLRYCSAFWSLFQKDTWKGWSWPGKTDKVEAAEPDWAGNKVEPRSPSSSRAAQHTEYLQSWLRPVLYH